MHPPHPSSSHRLFLWLLVSLAIVFMSGCTGSSSERLQREVDAAIVPMMHEYRIPGMAVAVVHHGKVDIFSYGVASRDTGRSVDQHTLFEIGSISKTFTGLLGAYVSTQGRLGLADPVSRHAPELAGSAFDRVTMGQLATYSAGGLPLQVPSHVTNDQELLEYFRAWTPEYPPGTRRLYSNPSIGLFGRVAARSAGMDFSTLMTGTVLPKLGLRHTFLAVPPSELDRYAFGYGKDERPLRVNPGVLDLETYGIKTCAADMGVYVQAQMGGPIDPALKDAIALTHVGRESVGPMTQGLGWDICRYPATLEDLQAANSADILFEANPVSPPEDLGPCVLVGKTGSTGGFGAYVAFVPKKSIGVVLLANRNYPIAARVSAAHQILRAIGR